MNIWKAFIGLFKQEPIRKAYHVPYVTGQKPLSTHRNRIKSPGGTMACRRRSRQIGFKARPHHGKN